MKFIKIVSIIGIVISSSVLIASSIYADTIQLDAMMTLILFGLIVTSVEAND